MESFVDVFKIFMYFIAGLFTIICGVFSALWLWSYFSMEYLKDKFKNYKPKLNRDEQEKEKIK